MSTPLLDPAWLDEHGDEVAAVYCDVRDLGLPGAKFRVEVTKRLLALSTPPPGGRDAVLHLAMLMRVIYGGITPPTRTGSRILAWAACGTQQDGNDNAPTH